MDAAVFIPKYREADKFIIFNDHDPQLAPIEYALPVPPPLETIAGYGLKPEDQFFDALKPKMPLLLKYLLKEKISDSAKVKRIDNDPAYYNEAADYIEAEWERRKSGFWFFNRGQPLWISGCYYFYLRYWHLETAKLPQFRLRDREFFLFVKMCEDDAFCYGFNYPKPRREGATTKVQCWRYEYTSRVPSSRAGLQSKNKEHAEEVHSIYMMEPWQMMPFYFRPVWDKKTQRTTKIRFYSPESEEHEDYGKDCLKSFIDYKDSGVKAYDGVKRHRLHNDELGKTEEVDVGERWETQKLILVDGSVIIGKAANTSTVDEMEKKGGAEFKKICDKSHYSLPKGAPENILPRNENGQTVSGLYNLFIPAQEGYWMEELDKNGKKTGRVSINKYGETDVKWTLNWILNERKALRESGDIARYIDFIRIRPIKWDDCWRIAAKECQFNAAVLDDRLNYFNENGNPFKRRGNFVWENNVQDSRVIWKDDPNGKFYTSFLFDLDSESNRFEINQYGIRCPVNKHLFIAGGDPYKYKPKKGSKGGGAVFMKRNTMIDPDGKPKSEWKTHRFCCTYSFRPRNQYIYLEDMLMMCIYYSCQMFSETNVDALIQHFDSRGYSQYEYYYFGKKGEIRSDAGMDTTEKTKEDIFAAYDSYIEEHGLYEYHDELLIECRTIANDMGEFDRFAAGGYALLGNRKNPFLAAGGIFNDAADIKAFFATYKLPEYSGN